MWIYDTLKLLARHIRRYAASVEQVNADFTINYMDVVPVQGVDQVDSDHIRFAIFDSHSRDRTGAITEDGSSLLVFYDTLKLLARHIRRYAASVEQVNADFTINYMDVVPFDLSSIVSPGAPRPHHHLRLVCHLLHHLIHQLHPPVLPVHQLVKATCQHRHLCLQTPTGQAPPVRTLMLGHAPTSRARAALIMTLHVTVPVLVPVPVQPSLSSRVGEEEKKEDPSYELRSGHGRSRPEAQVPVFVPMDKAVVLSAMMQWMTSA